VYGQDLAVLAEKAQQIRTMLAGIAGAVGTQVDLHPEAPTVAIEVDLAAAQRHGIKPGDVRRAAATLLSGVAVGSLFEEQKVFDVVVWGAPGIRQDLTAIHALLINTPNGGHVRLGEVAKVGIASSPTGIHHDAVSRYLDVTARVQGRSPQAVADEITAALKSVEFPTEYHAEVFAGSTRAPGPSRAWWYGLLAAAAVLLLLHACLGGWRVALLVLVMLPVTLAGGVLAGLIGGFSSLAVLAGLVAVLGIGVRDLIRLTREYQQLPGGEPERAAALMRRAEDHAPMLLGTAAAITLALIPVVVMGSVAGLELIRPIAIVMICGLVSSVLASLYLLPTLLLRFGAGSAAASEPDLA
jgi:Cu/Ag efflux pump CusA